MGRKTKKETTLKKEDNIEKLYRIKGAKAYYVELRDGTVLLRNYPTLPYSDSKEIISKPLKENNLKFFRLLFANRGFFVPYDVIKEELGIESINSTKSRVMEKLEQLKIGDVLKTQGKYGKETNGAYYLEDWFYECDETGKILDTEKLQSDFFESDTDFFSFSAYPDQLKIVGREDDIAKFDKIITSSDKIRIASITGSSGIGKSKLAYEIFRKYKEDSWNVFWIDRISCDLEIVVDKLKATKDNILIVIDDVQFCQDLFMNLMRSILSSEISKTARIRVIITTSEKNPALHYNRYSHYGVTFTNYELLTLHSSYLGIIVSNYYRTRSEIEKRSVDYKEIKSSIGIVARKIQELHIRDSRPLYALLMAASLYDGCNIDNWDTKEVIDYIINRENRKIELAIESLSIIEESDSYMNISRIIRMIATLTGGVSLDALFESGLMNELYIERRQFNTIKTIFCNLSLQHNYIISGVFPDIIGYAYCLQVLLDSNILTTRQFNRVIQFVLSEAGAYSIVFLNSIIDNLQDNSSDTVKNCKRFDSLLILADAFYGNIQQPISVDTDSAFEDYIAVIDNEVLLLSKPATFKDISENKGTNSSSTVFNAYIYDGLIYEIIDTTNTLSQLHKSLVEEIAHKVATHFSSLYAVSEDSILTTNLESIEPTDSIQSYRGETIWDIPHGKGVATWNDGTTCKGEFYFGSPYGNITFIHPDGRKYCCNINAIDDYSDSLISDYCCREGTGTYIWADGAKYTGEWKNGCRYGMGKMQYPGGTVLHGLWVDDLYSYTEPDKVDDTKYRLPREVTYRPELFKEYSAYGFVNIPDDADSKMVSLPDGTDGFVSKTLFLRGSIIDNYSNPMQKERKPIRKDGHKWIVSLARDKNGTLIKTQIEDITDD